MRLAFLILSLLLFVSKYFICDYFYPGNDIESSYKWNYLSTDMLHLNILTLLLSIKSEEKYFKLILYVFLGFSTSDIIDRWVFGITYFVWTDLIMITIVLVIAYRKYLISKIK